MISKYEYSDRIIIRIYDSDVLYSNVTNICYESIVNGFYGAEVFPNMVDLCSRVVRDTNVKILATISYPYGTFLPEQKAFEINDALAIGAHGVNVCIDTLNVRSKEWGLVRAEMHQAREVSTGKILNYIFEMEYFTDEQIQKCCEIACEEKIDGIITSTGLYSRVDENKNDIPICVTEKDVEKIRKFTGDTVKIIAQGHINSKDKAESLIKSGADFISIENAIPFLY